MSVETKSTPSFFYSSLQKVKKPTFTERAMEAFLNRNMVQFADFLAKAQNAGENLNAICRNNGETLTTALTKYVNPPYMDIAKGYNLSWSAKNSYNETVEYIKSCHAKNPAQKAILELFFTALEKAKTVEQQAVVNAPKNLEAAKVVIEIPKEEAEVAKEEAIDAALNAENKTTEAEVAKEEAIDAVLNAENKTTEAEVAKEEAVDAVLNAENKTTEAEVAKEEAKAQAEQEPKAQAAVQEPKAQAAVQEPPEAKLGIVDTLRLVTTSPAPDIKAKAQVKNAEEAEAAAQANKVDLINHMIADHQAAATHLEVNNPTENVIPAAGATLDLMDNYV